MSKKLPFLVLFALGLAVAAGSARAQDPNACDVAGEAPDVLVSGLGQVRAWGSLNGVSSFSVETISCNLGTCWALWEETTNRHPVIAQSMYRVRDGRLVQIGQSWLKHGFFALSEPGCSNDCVGTPDGTRLGVNCSDPYDAFLNGLQPALGPKYQVNPFTGEFPFPHAARGVSGDVLFKRIQVDNDDLDPALNPGATFLFEGHYVTPDDATAGRGFNNATTRLASVFELAPDIYGAATFGNPQIGKPAIETWKTLDPTVSLDKLQVPGEGRVNVAVKTIDLGNGDWRYEYAVHNLNSHRAVRSFSVPLPPGAAVTNVGFRDVEYHSGEIQDGTDWTPAVDAQSVSWSTVDYETDPAGNAIRWGTTYNFWFDAAVPPADTHVTLGLFGPGPVGAPDALTGRVSGPLVCDNDGTCDPGESCDTCPGDCGPPIHCCGNGVCSGAESPCSCPADCGLPAGWESACGDGIDDDCDGLVDCADGDCCGLGACGTTTDTDADTRASCDDCNDGDPTSWETPGEVPELTFDTEPTPTLRWEPAVPLGGPDATYWALRTDDPSSFIERTVCLASSDGETVVDLELPPPGGGFFYLMRATNGCRLGRGGLGYDGAGLERVGRECGP